MDSMTAVELDGEGVLTHTRVVRCARGSGTSIEEVHLLIEEYKKLSKVVSQLGKTNLGKGLIPINIFIGNEMSNIQRNPKQMMGKMKNALDPKMLSQLGGMGNIMSMMKEMGKMDGMEGLMK